MPRRGEVPRAARVPRAPRPVPVQTAMAWLPQRLLVQLALLTVAPAAAGTVSSAFHAAGTTKQQRYLSSFAYTTDSSSPMWTADDFITVDADGKERPWQNLILVTGNDTIFAQLSADVLHRTGQNLPMLWGWGGWRTDTQCWMVGRTHHCSQGLRPHVSSQLD